MGACNSCEATAVAAVTGGSAVGEATAARVVLAVGELQRFPGGTRASHAVKAAAAAEGGAGACFLCSADGLELGVAVVAVAPDEELQPWQLYFLLPAAMRRRPLQAEEMAALAIRASAALAGDHDGPLVHVCLEQSNSTRPHVKEEHAAFRPCSSPQPPIGAAQLKFHVGRAFGRRRTGMGLPWGAAVTKHCGVKEEWGAANVMY
ncbi:hypothetical protein ACQ4PT_001698 [Festuca glaucescens]